jgi:hypothetical protein
MKLCAFFHKRQFKRKAPADSTDYTKPLPENSLPASWVNDFLMPPFRDAAGPQDEAAQMAETLENIVQQMADDGGAPGGQEGQLADLNAGNYWCPPGAYWGQSEECWPEIRDMTSAMGLCPEQNSQLGTPSPLSLWPPSFDPHRQLSEILSPVKFLHDSSSDAVRLSAPSRAPAKVIRFDREGSPRRPSDGDVVADDSSTSAGEDFLAATGSRVAQVASRSRATSGAIGSATGAVPTHSDGTAGSSSASSSPWMVSHGEPQKLEPSWGNFSSAFDGYFGMLSVPGALNSTSSLDPTEPLVLPVPPLAPLVV